MKVISKIIVASVVLISLSVSALASPKLPVVEILGKNYYVYVIKKGDSLFGISREYGWNYDQLQQLNPKAVSPLEKGMKIYYPANDTPQPEAVVTNSVDEVAQPLSHIVKRGETVYAISRMYGIPVDRIYELNPGSKNGIKEGATLLLAEESRKDPQDNAEYYTIKKGDTLYGVAKDHYTTVAAIMKMNPGVSEKNFKADEVIKLPKKGTGVKSVTRKVEEEKLTSFSTYKVEKKDTWDTIAEKTGVDKSDLIEANGGRVDKPKNKSLITIPKIETTTVEKTVVEEDPRELTNEGIAEIYDSVHGIADTNNAREFKVALLLSEPASRKDLEFTRGFLTGVDRLKRLSTKLNVVIIDGNRNSTEVLNELSDVDPDLLFLTTEKGIPAYLSEYAEVSQTPMVNTFDVKNELYTRNPYIIQLLTPSNYFNDEIAAKIKTDYDDYTLLYAGTADEGDQLASAIKDALPASKIKSVSVESLSQYPFRDDGKYLIYGYPTKKDDVAALLDAVKEAKSLSPLTEIAVIGRPSWIVYDENAMEERFHSANVLIPSRFYYDKNSTETRKFENVYKSLFDRSPAKSFPVYACVGYDASLYFIGGLANAEFDINALTSSKNGVQSDFELYRPGNWTGMLNPIVYLVRFTPYNTIEKITVK